MIKTTKTRYFIIDAHWTFISNSSIFNESSEIKRYFTKAVLAVFWTLLFFFGKGNEKMVSVNNRSAHFI